MDYDHRFIDFLDRLNTSTHNELIESIKEAYSVICEASAHEKAPKYLYCGMSRSEFDAFKSNHFTAKKLSVVIDVNTALYDAFSQSRATKTPPYIVKLKGDAILNNSIKWKIADAGTDSERVIGSGDFSRWIDASKEVPESARTKAHKNVQTKFTDRIASRTDHPVRDNIISTLEREDNPYSRAVAGGMKSIRGIQNLFSKD